MEKTIELLEKFLHFIKWPYFIGYALVYNYGFNEYMALDLFWFFCAILITQDLYKKYKDEQKRKEQEEKEQQKKREAEISEIIEGSKE